MRPQQKSDLTSHDSAAAARRRSVAIVGAGMAGVSLAWLLDGARNVVLLEARDAIGGHVQTVDIDLDGHRFMVDLGAQYFHPGPYPVYSALLGELGLHDPDSSGGPAHSFPASITLTAGLGATPRFVSPILPERRWPFFAPWNAAGLGAFGVGFIAARVRDHLDQPWDITLDEWLPTLGLVSKQWEGMLLPWAASLFSGSLADARRLSARAAMIFAARALPANPFDPLHYYVLKPGMIAAMTAMVAQCSTVEVLPGTRVVSVARTAQGGFTIHRENGPPLDVDDLVLASSGPSSGRLLSGLDGTAARLEALGAIEFHQARVALHTDPAYGPADHKHRSFFNCDVQGSYCEASMWLAAVITGPPPAVAAKVWKSWFTHRARPQQVLHEAEFTHMLPTVDTIRAQDRLASMQGEDGIWLAGGYQFPYDAQETALVSALQVARRLGVTSGRSERLFAASNADGSKRKALVESGIEPVG